MPHAEQDMLTLPEHLISLLVFMGVHIALALVFSVQCCLWFCTPVLFSVLVVVYALSSFVLSCHNLVLSFGFWASDFPSVWYP